MLKQIPFQDQYQKLKHLVTTSLARAHHQKIPKLPLQQSPKPHPSLIAMVASQFLSAALHLKLKLKPSLSSWIMAVTLSGSLAPRTTFARSALSPPPPPPPYHHHHHQESNLLSLNNSHLPSFLDAKTLNALGSTTQTYTVIKSVVLELTRTPASTNYLSTLYNLLRIGTTGGIALSETLHLHNLTKPNFLVGCSVFSSRKPEGIAGFGRGLSSLPSKLGLSKFSYCLLSHRFDDTKKSSSLVLD